MKDIFKMLFVLVFVTSCSSPKTPEALKYQEIQKIISKGNNFPEYNAPNEKNKIISSTQFEKGYVFYMFWGTWCASCIDNIVNVRDMRNKGLLKDVQFVSVSVDEERDRWTNFLNQYDMADYMENVLIGKDREHVLSNFMYKEMNTPSNEKAYHYLTPHYCLVKDGVIVDNYLTVPKDRDEFLRLFN